MRRICACFPPCGAVRARREGEDGEAPSPVVVYRGARRGKDPSEAVQAGVRRLRRRPLESVGAGRVDDTVRIRGHDLKSRIGSICWLASE